MCGCSIEVVMYSAHDIRDETRDTHALASPLNSQLVYGKRDWENGKSR